VVTFLVTQNLFWRQQFSNWHSLIIIFYTLMQVSWN